jgi:hypothetical protein
MPAQDSATVNSLPSWYTDYAKQITGAGLGQLQNINNYQGAVMPDGSPMPRVAGLDPAQLQGYNQAQSMQGAWMPDVNAARGAMSSGLGTVGSASPMFSRAGGAIGAAGGDFNSAMGFINSASPNFNQAGNFINSATGNFNRGEGMIGAATGYFDQAGNFIRGGTANFDQAGGTFGTATDVFGQATGVANAGRPMIGQGQDALGAATGILYPAVGQTLEGSKTVLDEGSRALRDEWMNPYTGRINDEIARLGNQNLMEGVIPGINTTFVGDGQFGSTRNGEFMNRALRDNQTLISGAQAKMLMESQAEADRQYAAERGRQLQGGNILGGLSQVSTNIGNAYGNLANANTGISNALSNAGTGLTNVGIGQTNLGRARVEQGSALREVGDSRVNQGAQMGLIGAHRVNQGNAMTNLGTARVNQGNAATNVGMGRVAQGNAFTNVGNGIVNQGRTQAGIGEGLGALASIGQQARINDINALLTTGGLQQRVNQAGLDAAYEDFLDRRDYPLAAIGALSNIMPSVSSRVMPDTRTSQVSSTDGSAGGGNDPYRNIQDIINIINGK